jgi:hypothetical protein
MTFEKVFDLPLVMKLMRPEKFNSSYQDNVMKMVTLYRDKCSEAEINSRLLSHANEKIARLENTLALYSTEQSLLEVYKRVPIIDGAKVAMYPEMTLHRHPELPDLYFHPESFNYQLKPFIDNGWFIIYASVEEQYTVWMQEGFFETELDSFDTLAGAVRDALERFSE